MYMANILLITTYYPPIKTIASNRMVAFSKYLTEMGHNVFVIALGDKSVQCTDRVFYCSNNDTIKPFNTRKKENIIIHYAKCAINILQRWVNVYSSTWVNCVTEKAEKIITDEDIDVMITSYPLIDPLIAGCKLKAKYPDLKWILDMRDAVWTPGYDVYIRRKMIKITKRCLEKCDGVTTVSHIHSARYSSYVNRELFCEVIKNGYDFDVTNIERQNDGTFNIVYAGNFYGAIKPYNFLMAYDNFIKRYSIKNTRFLIIGNESNVVIKDYLKPFVKEIDTMEYFDLVEFCARNADLLMLIIPSKRESGIYTGKLFDYVGIGRPILGLVPKNDVAAELIKQAGNGYLAENESIRDIENAIYKAYSDWNNGTVPCINKSLQKSCHRREEVKKLSGLVDRILMR